MRRSVLAACILAAVLGGCARGDEPAKPIKTIEPSTDASSPSPRATERQDVCRLLTAKERRSIAGEEIDVVVPSTDRRQCRWVTSLHVADPTSITVRVASAQDWVRQLPTLINSTITEGKADDKEIKRLLDAKKLIAEGADTIGNKEACELFGLVVEVYRDEKDLRKIVVFQPSGVSTLAVAQTCTKGRYTSLTYAEQGLVPSRALSTAVLRVLDYAHRRSIKRASE